MTGFKIERPAEIDNDALLELYGRYFQGRGGKADDLTQYLLEVFLGVWAEDTAHGPFAFDQGLPGLSQFLPTALVLRDLFGGVLVRISGAGQPELGVVCLRCPILDMRPLFLWPLPFPPGMAINVDALPPGDAAVDADAQAKYRLLRERFIGALNAWVAPSRS